MKVLTLSYSGENNRYSIISMIPDIFVMQSFKVKVVDKWECFRWRLKISGDSFHIIECLRGSSVKSLAVWIADTLVSISGWV